MLTSPSSRLLTVRTVSADCTVLDYLGRTVGLQLLSNYGNLG